MRLLADGKTLYVALANRDAVAAVNVGAGQFAVKGYFDTRLPGQSYFGAEPVALALNADGSRLYVANMASDAVAVIDTRKLTAKAAQAGHGRAGRICSDGVDADVDGVSDVADGGSCTSPRTKGKGTGPNQYPPHEISEPRTWHAEEDQRTSHAAVWIAGDDGCERRSRQNLPQWTEAVLESNRMKAAAEKITFADAVA